MSVRLQRWVSAQAIKFDPAQEQLRLAVYAYVLACQSVRVKAIRLLAHTISQDDNLACICNQAIDRSATELLEVGY